MSQVTELDIIAEFSRGDLSCLDIIRWRKLSAFDRHRKRCGAYIQEHEAEGIDRTLALCYWFVGRQLDALESLRTLNSQAVVSLFLEGMLCMQSRDYLSHSVDCLAGAVDKAKGEDLCQAQMMSLEARLLALPRHELTAKIQKDAQDLVKQYPDRARAWALSAYAKDRVGDLEGALADFAKAFSIDPNDETALFRAAMLYDRIGEDEAAIKCYEALVCQNPCFTGAMMNLSTLYEDYERFEDAERIYEAMLAVNPNHRWARMGRQDVESSEHQYLDEEAERKEDKFEKVLRIPVTDFELSVRSRNCLTRMKIHTLGDLIRKTEQDLLSYKNFGETSLSEIKNVLGQKGLRLGMRKEEEERRYKSETQRLLAAQGNSEILQKPIEDLALGIRARKGMDRLGVRTVGDLVSKTANDLLSLRNFGQTSLTEIRAKLTDLSLKLKDD